MNKIQKKGVFYFMLESELPRCCETGQWVIYDTMKRLREVRRRGFSSLPRRAVCTTCGRVLLVDPGKPDEEFVRRKKAKQQKRNGFKQQNQEEIVQMEDGEE